MTDETVVKTGADEPAPVPDAMAAANTDVDDAPQQQNWRDIRFTVHDGITLYARDYGPVKGGRIPVICLAGLTRNSKDFHHLATHLSRNRRVLAPDYRGRGRSDYAKDYRSYAVSVEMADVFSLMTLAHIEEAVIVGTSRGGIIAMLMAAARPGAVKAVVLNDIGAVIPRAGLLRIAGYVRNMPEFEGWDEAAAALKTIHEADFTDLEDKDWQAFARRTFREENGRPIPDFDPGLAHAMDEQMDITTGEVPTMWGPFAALLNTPTLVLRGANSDLLERDTVSQMRALKRDLASAIVANRGHAPFLNEPRAVEAVERFIAGVD